MTKTELEQRIEVLEVINSEKSQIIDMMVTHTELLENNIKMMEELLGYAMMANKDAHEQLDVILSEEYGVQIDPTITH